MIKAIRMEIQARDDGVYKELFDARHDAALAANKIISFLYANDQFAFHLKEKDPDFKQSDAENEVYGKSLRTFCYDLAREKLPNVSTFISGSVSNMAYSKYKNEKREVLRGERSLTQYKRTCPLPVHARGIRLDKENGSFTALISVYSTPRRRELGLSDARVLFDVISPDKSCKAILERVIDGTYKQGEGKLIYKEKTSKSPGKWMLMLSVHMEPVASSGHKTLGIDIGVRNAVAMAIYDRDKEDFAPVKKSDVLIEGGAVEDFRKQMQKRRWSAGVNSKMAVSGRGYKRRCKKALSLSEKEKNFRDDYNHKLSRYIVDFAVKNGCDRIQAEDLKGFDAKDHFLKQWPYFDLLSKIEYKAAQSGIEFAKIDPKFTSKRCSHCGNINMDIRGTDVREWVCPVCGKRHDRDINAARNIAMTGIEEIIEKQCDIQGIEYKKPKDKKGKKKSKKQAA